MFCTHCGVSLGDPEPNFCPTCGQRTQSGAAFARPAQKRLERPISARKVGGVCAGFANYLNVDVTLIRLLAVIALIFSAGTGFVAYLVAMAVIPEEQSRPMEAVVRS
jgi:phage shock protein C